MLDIDNYEVFMTHKKRVKKQLDYSMLSSFKQSDALENQNLVDIPESALGDILSLVDRSLQRERLDGSKVEKQGDKSQLSRKRSERPQIVDNESSVVDDSNFDDDISMGQRLLLNRSKRPSSPARSLRLQNDSNLMAFPVSKHLKRQHDNSHAYSQSVKSAKVAITKTLEEEVDLYESKPAMQDNKKEVVAQK